MARTKRRCSPHSSLSNNSDDVRVSLDLRYNPTGQPTGRPEFPGFVARSRRDPSSELRDPEAWKQLKLLALERETSSHDLLIEALNALFRRHGKPPVV